MQLKTLCLSIAATCLPLQVIAAPADDDALTQVVVMGLQNALSLQNQKLTLERSKLSNSSAWFGLLPTLTLSGGQTQSSQESVSSGVVSVDSAKTNALSISANWTLWDGYQNISNIRSSQKALESDRTSSRNQVNLYVINLLEKFLEYQEISDRREILQNLLEQSKWTESESEALVSAGARTRLDAMDAEIQVLNTLRDLNELETSLIASDGAVRVYLNASKDYKIPQLDLLKLQPYFMNSFDVKFQTIKQTWKNTYSQMYPDLVYARLQMEQELISLEQTRLGYWPTTSISITHNLGLDRFVQPQDDNLRIGLKGTTLSLNLTWKFWDWWTTGRSIVSSEKSYQIRANSLHETVIRAESEMINLIRQFDIAEQSVKSSKLAVEKATQQQEYSREMYRLGRITLLSMQQSNNRLFEARNALASRLKNKFLAAAKILYASGEDILPAGQNMNWVFQ